jgi:integrase
MACVVKRRGKYVLDYYDQNGKRRWETTNGNKKEAELLLAQRIQEIHRGDFQARTEQVTFDELAASYVANVRVKVRDLTATEYDDAIERHILPYFSGRRVRAITSKDIEDFRSWLIKRGEEGVLIAGKREQLRRFGPATVNKLLTLTSMVFGYAVRHNWTASNPAARIEKVKRPARDDQEEQAIALEAGEVQRLIAAAHEPWCLIPLTAVKTGLRQSELLGLRWGDIDFDAGLLHVRRSFRLGSFLRSEEPHVTAADALEPGTDARAETVEARLSAGTSS